jgi:hypothetical protein
MFVDKFEILCLINSNKPSYVLSISNIVPYLKRISFQKPPKIKIKPLILADLKFLLQRLTFTYYRAPIL